MTDREVYEHLYRRYEKADTAQEIAQWERHRADADAAVEAMPLEDRKRAFWDLCRDFGCSEADTAAQWEAYLKGDT